MSSDSKIPANSRSSPALLLAAASRIEWKSPSLFLAAARSATTSRNMPTNNSINATPYSFLGFQSPPLRSSWNTPSPWNAYVPPSTLPPLPHQSSPTVFSPVTKRSSDTLSELLPFKDTPNMSNNLENVPPTAHSGKQSQSDLMSAPKNFLPPQHAPMNETSNPKANTITQELVSSFTLCDVICGRGRKPGKANQAFNVLLNLHASEYVSASKADKPFIVQKVVETIKSKRGRFLEKQTDGRTYLVMTEGDEIYKKVSEALRHASKPKLPPPPLRSDPNESTVSVYAELPYQKAESTKPSTKVPTVLGKPAPSRSNRSESQGFSPLSTLGQKKRAVRSSGTNPNPKHQKQESRKGRKKTVPKVSIIKTAETQSRAVKGVRIAVTKSGTFEVRYKFPRELKQAYPRYIATVSDRETGVWLGNLVARSIQNHGTTFEAAKYNAILLLNNLNGGADGACHNPFIIYIHLHG
eukprot:scaffold33_cov123-Amphora_coffeaeformis.AAC.1